MTPEHKVFDEMEIWTYKEPKAHVAIYYPSLQSNWIGTVVRKVEHWCDEGIDVRTYAEAVKLAKEWCEEIETKHFDDWPNKHKRLEILRKQLGIDEAGV